MTKLRLSIAAGALACCTPWLSAQTEMPATEQSATAYTGCVTAGTGNPGVMFFKGEDGMCSQLSGTFKKGGLLKHRVVLKGELLAPTEDKPSTLKVISVESVEEACSDTCKPAPQGIHSVESDSRPGTEGGTPGATSQTPPHK